MSEWQEIETCPDEGEFLAYDPVSGKQDVCTMIIESVYGPLDLTTTGIPYTSRRAKVGTRRSCTQVQEDYEYGPDDDQFQGERATHWMPLPTPPKTSE